MKARRSLAPTIALAALAAAAGGACAQGFTVETAVLDSRSAQNLGVTREQGPIADLLRAQKALTFGILRSAGVSLDQLSPEVRARIERLQTTSVEAFRAFSQGLDLKDQGRFQEAKEAFRRAAEIDPAFQLAVEQQQAMPDVNVTTTMQLRAVAAAAVSAAVDRGRNVVAVDLSRAVAALASGQTVIALPATQTANATAVNGYEGVNAPGSADKFQPNLIAGLAYQGVPFQAEVSGDNYRTSNGVLESMRAVDDKGNTFTAVRGGASVQNAGSTTLADGSQAYWGRWAADASATVAVNDTEAKSPALGPVDFVYGQATRQLPTAGAIPFTPAGGSMTGVTGTLNVDFGQQRVAFTNLGFTIGSFAFTGLAGGAGFDKGGPNGAFSGNYTAGSCTGCTNFAPAGGAFGGNFLGRDASGLAFWTVLPTGSTTTPTVSGVQVFKH